MEVEKIEHLWYTWSGLGIRRVGLGMQIRAASPGLMNQSEAFYRFVEGLATYTLPDGVDPYTKQSPICLALIHSPVYGKLLLRKVYVGRDGFGRSGNFFTHLLVNLPENFTAREAIELWEADFWQSQDLPEETRPVRLLPLSLETVP